MIRTLLGSVALVVTGADGFSQGRHFQDFQQLTQELDYTTAMALGDVDGDGDLDALAGNAGPRGSQNRLLVNDGTGTFSDATGVALPARRDYTAAVVLGDVDGDGDLDALIGLYFSSVTTTQNRLYRNDGRGQFSDDTVASLPVDSDLTLAVVPGDVDGDGDLDVVFGNLHQPNRLYTNLRGQLALRGQVRIAQPLTLDIWGPAHGAWQLVVSRGPGEVSIPPFGTLRLDPLLMSAVSSGPLDATREGAFTSQIPGDPNLVGLSFYWQAMTAFPLRLTNLEITTISS